MKITIDRAWRKQDYTISRVFINGERFGDGKKWCSVLEDTDRGLTQSMSVEEIKKLKVYGQTAIPRGIYEVQITYSPKFKRMLPLVMDVPGRSGIRVHRGTRPEHSRGCILVSAAMEQELTAKWLALQASNEPIKLKIENEN